MANQGKKPTRRSERALAFQVLYGLSFTPATSEGALRAAYAASPDVADRTAEDEKAERHNPATAPQGYAWEVIHGVWKTQAELDEAVSGFSQNWRVERMGRVELTLLRIAVYEMLFRDDVPAKVAMNEAIELSKQFGDDNSRGFINGILDAVARAVESGRLTPKGQ
ncbi:transcription antitermination factor NusB [Desulfovibrio oxamicus]|uniref:Transcription antitermination protein NusB n=1 Tax=Nitratidesulfovibrio oxamicus TaxID=32016 RepID=A0ABS0IZU2_9BACT|nr:transcription antitermination factor NusB [Nitratidesulfovibrio oxamicus]MBG3875693.1 transcription antitermination factor NusB [Nitratidesulfovibrio oxamicus]